MAQEETILLHFDIDEQPAVQSIKDLRTANSQLRAERDKVNISTKEGQELVQKLNVTIDKNNKLIKDNSSALEKQRQNVGNYSKSIQEAAGNLNVMGTNVGGLAATLKSFVNPATAAVGIVTALGAAYARSTIGAKDLEFAQNQLAFATTYLTNQFAGFISSTEDGEGAVSKLTNAVIAYFDRTAAAISKVAALAQEELQQVQRDQQLAQVAINDRLSENAELLTEISNSETTIAQKKEFAQKIEDNIVQSTNERLALINREIAATEKLIIDAEDKEFMLNKLFAERSNIQRQETKQLEKIEKQLNGIINAEDKRLQTEREKTAELERQARITKLDKSLAGDQGQDAFGLKALAKEDIRISDESLKALQANEKAKGDARQEYVDRVIALQETEAEASRDLAGTLTALAEQGTDLQKGLAATTIAINSGIGVSEAVKAGAGIPWPANLGAILSGITAVLAGIAQAKNLLGGAAAGGGDFVTTKPTLLMVGDNPGGRERVTVEPLSGKGKTQVNPRSGLLQMAGGGSLTVNDGGFVTNTNMQASQQAMIMANALKNLPAPKVAVVDIIKVQKRIEAKEKVTRQ